ncbi:MAG: DUF2156 domain-containing protein [Candidatus Levybacteria bacterium]|nr:DUF2156 domain-containing protein [Candidatus Levybacteria bacterium]
MHLPHFPNQKKLLLEDRDLIVSITNKYDAYSDFNFVSLWGYDTSEDVTISTIYDNLVVKFKDYMSDEQYYSFIGTANLQGTIHDLLTHSKEVGIKEELRLIPEACLTRELIELRNFAIEEDRDNLDYVLSIDELSHLQGSRYQHHRKAIRRFFRNYPSASVKRVDLSGNVNSQIIDVFLLWKEKKGKSDEETRSEFICLQRTLSAANQLPLISLGIYVENLLIGFIICDTERDDYAESHFLKFDPSFDGVKFILHHHMAMLLLSKGYRFLNIEQDLGLPGLRYAKERCLPIKFLKKYTIREAKNR